MNPALALALALALPAAAPSGDDVDRAAVTDVRSKVAWALLATGRDEAALRQFARLSHRRPGSSRPKVGAALAATLAGDRAAGASSLRRALRIAPDALRGIEIDPRLAERLEALATRHLRDLATGGYDADTAMVLGAIAYMRQDDASARVALKLIRADAARDSGMLALEAHLEELIHRDDDPPPVASQAVLPPAPQPDPPTAGSDEIAGIDEMDEIAGIDPAAEQAAPVPDAETPPPPADAAPAPPPEPLEPIDYDELRRHLESVASALDRFTQKLLAAIAGGAGN